MAKDEHRRLPPSILDADQATLSGVLELAGYAPSVAEISIEALQQIDRALKEAQRAEARAARALVTARSEAIRLEWALHNALLRSKDYVRGQYGDDDYAMTMMGLKRKSARRRPPRRTNAPAEPDGE